MSTAFPASSPSCVTLLGELYELLGRVVDVRPVVEQRRGDLRANEVVDAHSQCIRKSDQAADPQFGTPTRLDLCDRSEAEPAFVRERLPAPPAALTCCPDRRRYSQ